MQITKKDINYTDVTISKVTPQMKVRDSEALDDRVEYSVLRLTEQNFGEQNILFTRHISVHYKTTVAMSLHGQSKYL